MCPRLCKNIPEGHSSGAVVRKWWVGATFKLFKCLPPWLSSVGLWDVRSYICVTPTFESLLALLIFRKENINTSDRNREELTVLTPPPPPQTQILRQRGRPDRGVYRRRHWWASYKPRKVKFLIAQHGFGRLRGSLCFLIFCFFPHVCTTDRFLKGTKASGARVPRPSEVTHFVLSGVSKSSSRPWDCD